MNSITISQIQKLVAKETKISVSEIKSPSRKQNIVQARHISMYFCRFKTNHNLLTIAKEHGRDNHATVIHACTCIDYDRRKNVKLIEILEKITIAIKNF